MFVWEYSLYNLTIFACGREVQKHRDRVNHRQKKRKIALNSLVLTRKARQTDRQREREREGDVTGVFAGVSCGGLGEETAGFKVPQDCREGRWHHHTLQEAGGEGVLWQPLCIQT